MARKVMKYIFEEQSENRDYLFSFDSDVMTLDEAGKVIDEVLKQILDEMGESHPDCVFDDEWKRLYAALDAAGIHSVMIDEYEEYYSELNG